MSYPALRRALSCARLAAGLAGGGILPLLLPARACAADATPALSPAVGVAPDAPSASPPQAPPGDATATVPSGPAPGNPAPSVLPTVSVTADAGDAPAFDPDLPASVESVSREQFGNWNVVNSEDTLKYLPNLAVRKRFIGDQNSLIAVRGTSNSQSARGLVYADGLLLSNLLGNSFSFAPRWSMVAPDEIDRVDVIYGPYSALYPGNSLGATVLMTTRMPEAFEAHADVKGYTQHFDLFGVDRDFTGGQSSASFGDRVGKLSYRLDAGHLENTSQPLQFATLPRSTTPARAGDTPVTGARFYENQTGAPTVVLGVNGEGIERTVEDQFKLKLRYDFTPTLQGGATVGYWRDRYRSDTSTFLRDPAGNKVYQGTVDIGGYEYAIPASALAPSRGDSENWLYGLSLKTRNPSGWNGEAIASYYDVARNVARNASQGGPGDGPGTVTYGNGTGWKTLDLRSTYTQPASAAGLAAHDLAFGYHVDSYFSDSRTFTTDDWSDGSAGAFANAFKGNTQTQAWYAQDAWRFLPRWKFVYGLRYEDWRAYGGSQAVGGVRAPYPNADQHHASPKASLSFDATDDLTLRASIGRAYRFPTVGELFQGKINGSTLINNNPDLQPENDLSKELTAQWTGDSGVLRVSLFQDDVKNTIFSQTDTTTIPNVTSFQNIDKVRSRGVETAYQGQDVGVRGLDLIANLAYTQSKILANSQNPASVGKYFYRIPLWRANLAVTYRFGDKAALTGAVRYSGRQYNTLTNTDSNPDVFGGTSTYTVVDAKFTYRLNRYSEVSVGVDNLFNERYFVYHPYPGRTLYVETRLHL